MPQLICTPNDFQELRKSVAEYGFGCLFGSIAPGALQGLQAEALERYAASCTAEQSNAFNYRANVISLGPTATKFLCESLLIDFLSQVFGEKFVLADQKSCFTFYRAGDHLGAHRDEPEAECSITVIVYLAARGPLPRSSCTGLELRVYGEDMANAATPRLTIPTQTGAVVVGRGSKVWHERPKLNAGESVDALTACYRRVSRADLQDGARV
jgi:hypothetical protein